MFWSKKARNAPSDTQSSAASGQNTTEPDIEKPQRPERWTLGILNDKETEEVPGTVLLLAFDRNEPLGFRPESRARRNSESSMPPQPLDLTRSPTIEKKKTANGRILLDPQPEDSLNDPLNWPSWRRDLALLSLGLYCMVGGGTTPILAAGFHQVSDTLHASYVEVARTTGLYMMGMGLGSVFFSPTAILFGKRPVYLISAVMFIGTSIWCAAAPNYANLVAARVFQGFSVSPVECLPSATIAEIFFLHERAYRIGIYTLLLLGGKNLVPLVSAVVVGSLSWRWVFWILAMVIAFCWILLFLFVPETFWDRTPRPKPKRLKNASWTSLTTRYSKQETEPPPSIKESAVMSPRQRWLHEQNMHARFEEDYFVPSSFIDDEINHVTTGKTTTNTKEPEKSASSPETFKNDWDPSKFVGIVSDLPQVAMDQAHTNPQPKGRKNVPGGLKLPGGTTVQAPAALGIYQGDEPVPHLHNLNSPFYEGIGETQDYFSTKPESATDESVDVPLPPASDTRSSAARGNSQSFPMVEPTAASESTYPEIKRYTTHLREAPPKSYVETLRPWNGRLSQANWFHVALRPFILFAYPAVLWSALIYSLSVGWLIVMSESVSYAYQSRDTYNFSPLSTGLIYLSPLIGGILGTGVAGKVSDFVVQFMARRNGGVYEPEFRLIMAIPVAISTAIGLMGFGWSIQDRNQWMVPTIFFGIISFGCSLGSTTSITFCVDSYRQYAGEALVTLNFSKNIFHGLVFSLFFPGWLESDGAKTVFLWVGGIQIACCLTTIPMYMYGKRARMWTVRRRFMENF